METDKTLIARPCKKNLPDIELRPGEEFVICPCGNECLARHELENKGLHSLGLVEGETAEFKCTECILKASIRNSGDKPQTAKMVRL